MKNIFTSNMAAALAVALALGVFSAFAQDAHDQRGLVTDSNGAPSMSGFGLSDGHVFIEVSGYRIKGD
jgi:hypothetical protein